MGIKLIVNVINEQLHLKGVVIQKINLPACIV